MCLNEFSELRAQFLFVILGMDFTEGQKTIFFRAVVYECRLKIWLYGDDSCLVYVIFCLYSPNCRYVNRLEPTILKKRKPALFRLLCIYQQFCDCFRSFSDFGFLFFLRGPFLLTSLLSFGLPTLIGFWYRLLCLRFPGVFA